MSEGCLLQDDTCTTDFGASTPWGIIDQRAPVGAADDNV